MKILYHPKFAREYKKLSDDVKDAAEEKERLFREDPFHLKLHTHKLRGPLAGFWAFLINQKYRIIFDFVSKDIVRFYSTGDHDI